MKNRRKAVADPIIAKILRMPKSYWDFLQANKKQWGGNNVQDQLRELVKRKKQAAENEAEIFARGK